MLAILSVRFCFTVVWVDVLVRHYGPVPQELSGCWKCRGLMDAVLKGALPDATPRRPTPRHRAVVPITDVRVAFGDGPDQHRGARSRITTEQFLAIVFDVNASCTLLF